MILDINHTYALVLGLAVILFTGLLFGKVANWLHVPKVTGYLIGGLLAGPGLWGLLFPSFGGIVGENYVKSLEIFTSIELGFIAFSVGSEFKVAFLKQVGIMPVVIAFAESLAAVVFITGGLMLIPGMPFYFALALGAVGGATAPAATVMVIKQYKAAGTFAKTTLSVVALDDASALIFFGFAMAVVRSILPGKEAVNMGLTVAMPFIEILGSLAMGVASGFILSFLIRFFMSRGNRTSLVIALLFLNIGISLFIKEMFNLGTAENPVHLGLSSLLSCMAMGAIYTNTSKTVEAVMPLIDRITAPLVIIFFVLAGADLKLEAMSLSALGVLAIYLVFRIAGKIFGTWASAKAVKAPPVVQKWLGWGLLPQGGIAIGLSLIVMQELNSVPAVAASLFSGNMVRLVVLCAVFVSEIFGPILLKYALLKSGEGVNDKPQKRKNPLKAAAPGQPLLTGGEAQMAPYDLFFTEPGAQPPLSDAPPNSQTPPTVGQTQPPLPEAPPTVGQTLPLSPPTVGQTESPPEGEKAKLADIA
ncbi:MAG: cation:proton antiporter [Clostridiales bacterium]|jgi:NhaP-type Na+/H+ or K+/H+ antiporter|nr:cation:proton antiporter [Clostridiales bacterium]